jgi:hypothetical protein
MPSNMNDTPRPEGDPNDDEASRGPNLVLLYGLIALAMALAIALAAWIILPFYRRH